MWKCPKCERDFQKTNQSHSCREAYPIEKHFNGKLKAKELYDFLVSKITSEVGPFTVDSRECCIHFVKGRTFTACWPIKDKIRIDFSLDREVVIKNLYKMEKLSLNRYLYYLEIDDESKINSELLGWLKDSYNLAQK